jgi:hypothetical protein
MKINIHPTFLQMVYFVILLFLLAIIIYSPSLINGPVHLTRKLIVEEDTVEGILVGILFIVSILIVNLYKNEVYKHKELIQKINTDKQKVEDRLYVSDQYIGMVNVQLREINSTYDCIENYPKTKPEFKEAFRSFGKRLLGIVKSDWVLIRIIDSKSQRSLSEHFETMENLTVEYPHVSNKLIIEQKQMLSHISVVYNPKNLDMIVFCILPVEKISPDEEGFIKTILDELTKMFLIINSSHYKNKD